MQTGNDSRPFGKARQLRGFTGHASDDLVGARGRRQGVDEILQSKQPKGVLAVVLRFDIGEGGARFGAVRTDDPGQAEPQPVLAAAEMADALIAFRLHFADPGKQCRWRGDVRDLSRQFDRQVGDIALRPPVDDRPCPAVQRENGPAKRLPGVIEQVDAVSMRGSGNALYVACRSSAEGNRFANGIGRRVPQFIHVALDMACLPNELRDATSGDCKRRAVDIEDDCLGDCQTTINPEQCRHSDLPHEEQRAGAVRSALRRPWR